MDFSFSSKSDVPKDSVYLREIEHAERQLLEGTHDDTTLNSLVHGKVGIHYEMDLLPDDWQVFHFDGADFIVHDYFLRIQDNFPELEHKFNAQWDSGFALVLLRNYIKELLYCRKLHQTMYQKAYGHLSPKEQEKLDRIIHSTYYKLYPAEQAERFITVGVPFHQDEQSLWQEFFGVSEEVQSVWPRVSYAGRTGVFYASAIYRNDNPPCCDFFSLLSEKSKFDAKTMISHAISHARSDGSHGQIDFLIQFLSGIKQDIFGKSITSLLIYDDIPLVDESALKVLDIYINNPERVKDVWNDSGSKLFLLIMAVLKKRYPAKDKDDIWVYTLFRLFRVLLQLSSKLRSSSLHEHQKFVIVLERLLKELKIPRESLLERK